MQLVKKAALSVAAASLLALAATPALLSQNGATATDAPVDSSITGVTVFLSGAEVQREASVALNAGTRQLVFDQLPAGMLPQSIQVAGTGNFTILGVSHRVNHLKPEEKTAEVAGLEASLKSVGEKLESQRAALADCDAETEMLKQNAAIGGSQTGVKTAELKEFAEFYRAHLNALTGRRLALKSAASELEKEKAALESQLRQLQSSPRRPTSSVVVEVAAPAAVQAKMQVSYLVYDAGWTPSYDLRASDVNGPVELTYKANVRQNTGEAWNDVKPVLSTANPTVSNTKPELDPWYLSFYTPAPPSAYQSFNSRGLARSALDNINVMGGAAMRDGGDVMAETEAPAAPAASAAELTSVAEGQTSVEFTIDTPYTIPSDGQTHAVELAKHSLPATYEYYAVRKLDKDVFLLAKVSGWEQLNLLSGPANAFFEGRYVGESYIETRRTDDELTLSLGRDKNITVTRIRKRDFTEKQFLGGNVTETREWDLTVHNKKRQVVAIVVEDQVPVPTDEKIKVEVQEVSGARLDAETGKLTWNLTVAPSATHKMTVKYSVKYPKNRTVPLE
jgi:uncharacterized protein (TIGR02231 family)